MERSLGSGDAWAGWSIPIAIVTEQTIKMTRDRLRTSP
jgi:hypothetical protein